MKLRFAPLDDVYLEARLVLAADGGQLAGFLLWLFGQAYGCLRGLMLAVLRCQAWRNCP
jgi:hypothetical protein